MAANPSSPPAGAVNVKLHGELHFHGALWSQFQAQYGEWLARFPADEPIYALPRDAIDSLARPASGKIRGLFSPSDTKAETAFSAFCSRIKYVGMQANMGVRYGLFDETASPIDQATASMMGWSRAQTLQINQGLRKADSARARLRGVVGWLLTEPAFLKQRDELREYWELLESDERPTFPLGRPRRVTEAPERAVQISVDGQKFIHRLAEFLNYWSLIELSTWDLPNPQGPMLPDFPKGDALNRPPDAICIYLPFHHPLIGDDDLHRQILNWQRQRLAARGISTSLAGLAHHEQYARFFQIIHLEQSIRSRFPLKDPRGLVDHIAHASARALRLSSDHVRKARKLISKCRRGGRGRIKSLQPRG